MSTGRTWEHRKGDLYVYMASNIVGTADNWNTEWHSVGALLESADLAWRCGLRELDRSDDFNVGVLRGGKLVATLWGPDAEVVDEDPLVVRDIAVKAGLS